MEFRYTVNSFTYNFKDLKTLMAKASPYRTGDALAGICAETNEERVGAQFALSEVPLSLFLTEHLIPYESDEVTRLIVDSHDQNSFSSISHLTVGDFRNWLLLDTTNLEVLGQIKMGLTPEMVAAVSKIMRNQDLIAVAQKCEVISRFRTTVGQKGRLSIRLQPNHPTDSQS